MPNWATNDIFSESRKLTIVTGPSDGLGLKAAPALAADGALQ
jgi:NAD(P)-dependent dehydrogenase (short-subunit alcohol dehydrogenase family)